MAYLENLVAALRPLFPNGGVHASTFPEWAGPLPWPACRYTIVTASPFVTACGDLEEDDEDGDDDTADVVLQLDVIAQDFDSCVALRKAVRKRLKTLDPPAICSQWQMTFDVETKVHRAILNYSLHASSAGS